MKRKIIIIMIVLVILIVLAIAIAFGINAFVVNRYKNKILSTYIYKKRMSGDFTKIQR